MGNKAKFCLHLVINSLLVLMTSGAIVQTFLLEKGLSEKAVGWFLSVVQIIQVFSTLIFSSKADNLKSVVNTSAYLQFLEIPLNLFLLLICFISFKSIPIVYSLLIAVGIVYGISKGINSVLGYKLPYSVMDIKDYGSITSLAGILGGIFCTAFSIALSYMQNQMEYFSTMKYVYGLSLILIAVHILAVRLMRPTQQSHISKTVTEKINLFKYKPFSILILPNLLRGFCSGIIGLAVTIGYYTKLVNSAAAGVIVVITNIVVILGCFAYLRINKKIKDKSIILTSCVAIAVSLPLMVLGNTRIFFIFYAIVYFFETVASYVVPVTVTKIVDYEVMGQYSAGRMLLHTLGTALAGFICIPLLKVLGVGWTLCSTGIMQVIAGLIYYFYLRSRNL